MIEFTKFIEIHNPWGARCCSSLGLFWSILHFVVANTTNGRIDLGEI